MQAVTVFAVSCKRVARVLPAILWLIGALTLQQYSAIP